MPFGNSICLYFSIFISYLYPCNMPILILELWRLPCGYRELWHRFSASTQDSSRQTSLHIEICMRIDEFKSNRYVGPKINTIVLRIASVPRARELLHFFEK